MNPYKFPFYLQIMWIQIFNWTLLTLAMTSAQNIQVYDLTRNPGLLTLQTGNTLIKTGRHRIYHAIELDKYQHLLNNVETTLEGMSIFTDFTDVNIMLQTKLKDAKNAYRKLLPTKRLKRALSNFFGSTIKAITGNLDENDLVEINKDINDLRLGHQELVRQNNIQVTINKHLEARINKIIESVNNQQKIIRTQILTARQSLIEKKILNRNFTAIRLVFKISYHIDIVQKHLDSIFEVIQLEKFI